MFVKTTNGKASKYPYTLGELRRENPNTSFPKVIPEETLASYGVYKVEPVAAPKFDNKTYMLTDTVENIDGVWRQKWVERRQPEDRAISNVRRYRDQLLAETDWMALNDNTLSPEWASYRQALRDITDQEGFPFDVVWPTKPE